jgi:hypothetical protein
VERDLFGALVADGTHGAGIAGDESSLTLLTRNVNMPDALRGGDGAYRDLQRVAYQFQEGSRTLTARVQSLVEEGAERSSGGASPETISTGFGLVRFRYHNGSTWSESFDSQSANRLPSAIEVAVWFESPKSIDPAELMSSLDAMDEPNAENADAPFMFDEDAALMSDEAEDESLWPLPDRLRVIVIPDGPEFDTGRSYEDVVTAGSPLSSSSSSPLSSSSTPTDSGGEGE